MSETDRPQTRRFASLVPSVIVWGLVLSCCVFPVCWIVFILATNRSALVELRLDSFRIHLIERTVLYNICVAIVAVLLAIVPALVLGRGRGILARLLWFILPISLLMPSLTFAYGWKQALRLVGFDNIELAGLFDVSRCVWSLATWLWPVPAVMMGLSLRRLDVSVQQQAQLDGGMWRVTLRHLIGPALASGAIVAALAMQEFAVYEPTGISVIATETRMVFETGAFSSPDNPITQAMGSGVQGSGGQGSGLRGQGSGLESNLPDQPARAAAAVATCVPMLAVVALLSIVAGLGVRKLNVADSLDFGGWPRSLDAGVGITLLSWLIVFIALGVPIVAMIRSYAPTRQRTIAFVWAEFGPQVIGTIFVAGITGAIAMVLALAASVRRNRAAAIVSLLSFLIGGQLVAIALIRLYNHPQTVWVYQSAGPVIMAYIARFGWIVLFAAVATWSPAWRGLRDLASVDGANRRATARHIIWPLAWPILAASALFVATLSMSEVPATVLLAPQQPQMLVPLLMTWVHALRSDPMIEASLATAAVVLAIGSLVALLAWAGMRRNSQITSRNSQRSSKGSNLKISSWSFFVICVLCVVSCVLAGCHAKDKPEAIWLESGGAIGQVVYPRGLAYSSSDDTFFIVDRSAHVQHLDSRGSVLNDWHMPLQQQGKPVGLTVGPDGDVYVPDTHYHRVMVYSPKGELLKTWGERGTGPGQFIYPTDIAFDAQKNIYISEYGDNDRVQVFDSSGKYLREFGKFGTGDGEFSRPQSIVIDGDTIYITDACNHRLDVFKLDGTFVRTMGTVGSAPGQFRFPYGLDMDRDGDLIVCEFGNNRVQKIDKQTGKCKGIWGGAGREPGQLAYPWGVAVDKRGRIVAVDAGNNRLQVFEF